MNSFLICHRGALGDFILTWPALHSLKELLPNYQFLGVGRPEYMNLAIRLGLLDKCFNMESSQLLDFFSGKAIPSDLKLTQGAILWLSAIGERQKIVAILKEHASLPIVLVDPFPQEKIHVALHHYQSIYLYYPIEIPENISPYFPLDIKKENYILIHMGSGSPTKNFPILFYKKLANELKLLGYSKICFTLGPAEEALSFNDLTTEWIEKPKDVQKLAVLLSKAILYIGNDSGVSHLSAVLGTPTIALYKITDPKIWGVLGKKVKHIFTNNEQSALNLVIKAVKYLLS
ncbi:MAG: glycosyltransferase family 9 protein [bacterium]